MGWFGTYDSITDVMAETKSSIKGKYTWIDCKYNAKRACMFVQDNSTKEYIIDYIIFRDDMYKPLPFLENLDFVPKTWIDLYKKEITEKEKLLYVEKQINEFKEYKNKKRKKSKELNNLFVKDKIYLIYNLKCKYLYKDKRKFIFIRLDDNKLCYLTSNKINIDNIKLIDEI